MFARLKESRSLLMGLAILGVVIFHAPFVISNYKLRLIHDNLCCGVDVFLFCSGLGACHSIRAHGGKGYLKRRAQRLLPGLLLILIPWSILMKALGYMTWPEFFGSVTLTGWWLGFSVQLNWYFSAVWLFFLLAIPLYRLFCRVKHPVLLWLLLSALTLLLQWLLPGYRGSMLMCRMLIFLTGMLFGRLEQLGFRHENRLRLIAFLFLILGLWYMVLDYRYDCWGLGYRLGLWWYPYALFTSGGVILISDMAAYVRRLAPLRRCIKLVEELGQSSGEILMIHMAVFKVILSTAKIRNIWWVLVILFCLCAGVFYRKKIVPHLPFSA